MPISPEYPTTAEPLDIDLTWDLSDVIVERAGSGAMTPSMLAEVAAAEGQPVAVAYVAASIDPSIPWDEPHDVTMHVCAGACQAWGTVGVIARLIEVRDERIAAGQATFNIRTHPCLNHCDRSPIVVSTGAHGQAVHAKVQAEQVHEMARVLCDP